jgi:hypothetical protein
MSYDQRRSWWFVYYLKHDSISLKYFDDHYAFYRRTFYYNYTKAFVFNS